MPLNGVKWGRGRQGLRPPSHHHKLEGSAPAWGHTAVWARRQGCPWWRSELDAEGQAAGWGGRDSFLSTGLRACRRRKVAGEGTLVERGTAQLGRRVGFFGESDCQSGKGFGSAFPVRSRVQIVRALCGDRRNPRVECAGRPQPVPWQQPRCVVKRAGLKTV